MNSIILIGRMTKDAEVRYTDQQLAIARFTLAVNRQTKKDEEQQADFINIVVFGKFAENVERYTAKGKLLAVQGRVQTGSYTNKDGNKVYTTEVVAERVEFLEWKDNKEEEKTHQAEDFEKLNDSDLPF